MHLEGFWKFVWTGTPGVRCSRGLSSAHLHREAKAGALLPLHLARWLLHCWKTANPTLQELSGLPNRLVGCPSLDILRLNGPSVSCYKAQLGWAKSACPKKGFLQNEGLNLDEGGRCTEAFCCVWSQVGTWLSASCVPAFEKLVNFHRLNLFLLFQPIKH